MQYLQVECEVEHSVVLPYEIFSFLYHKAPRSFAARFLGSSEVDVADASAELRRHD